MASGKQTPRQKMINLMYLVFIAMMALNMSKEVLSAFGMMNESLTEANQAATERNNSFMTGLTEKAAEQPEKYKELATKAKKVQVVSSELNNYIATLKEEALKTVDNPTDYETMDKSGFFDEKFYQSKVTKAGQEFVGKIDAYRNELATVLGDDYESILKDVNRKFSTAKVTDREGVKKDWIHYNFVGYPLVASVTKLTQMQADIKTIENQILSAMLSGQLKDEVSMTNYTTLMETSKSAYFGSDTFDGQIVLGRKDATTKPNKVELKLDGRALTEGKDFEIKDGRVALTTSAGSVGEHTIEGKLIFNQDGEPIEVPVKQTYTVIPKPNAAVISADKMNVVYRGVNNPMTISIPGVPSVSANAPGLSSAGGAGKYVMNVTSIKSREVKINVSGKLPNGETVSDSKNFRIKEIPRPVGTVRGEDGNGGPVRMQRNGLQISTISAKIPDFDFDLKLAVSGFKMQVAGQPIVEVHGQKLNGAAKRALQNAKRGDVVQIFDIRAKIAGNSSYRLPSVSPVIVQLTN